MQEGTTSDTPKSEDYESKPADEVLIAHAERLWHAAEENANRIAAKSQILAGAIIALLGFGFFSVGWLQQTPVIPLCDLWATATIHALLLIVLLAFASSLGRLYYRRNRQHKRSSDLMEFTRGDKDEEKRPRKHVVFTKVYTAYINLRDRNEVERKHLLRAQAAFSVGVSALMAAIFVYLIGSLPHKMYPESVNYDHIIIQSKAEKR